MHASANSLPVAADQHRRPRLVEMGIVLALVTAIVTHLIMMGDTASASREAHEATVISHGSVNDRSGTKHYILAQAGERQVRIYVEKAVQDALAVGSTIPVEVEIGGWTGSIRANLQRPPS